MDVTGYFRPQTHTFVPTPRKYKIQWGWHGDGVEDEQLLRQSSFDIVAGFGDNVAVFGDTAAGFGDIVAGVDGALDSLLIVREDAPDAHRRPLERTTLFFFTITLVFLLNFYIL